MEEIRAIAKRTYCALVHYPVRDRTGQIMTSAITNIDVHDIARSARTYGLAGYFVVTPITAQRQIVQAILDHWQKGAGARRIPERKEALERCWPAASIEEVVQVIEVTHGLPPLQVATEARPFARETCSPEALLRLLASTERPSLILFGTAHGLHASVLKSAEFLLEPICGIDGYNHLSVRAAAAIVFDRLFGRWAEAALPKAHSG
ncbi:MAG: RNA methyltransferase [Sandaracinaceae bacterium]|nr:RNA methyltransferase [Sandaracinaceae bacterium]